jgi:Putative addiction module component
MLVSRSTFELDFASQTVNAVLKKMSRADKLRAMEDLWSDLTRDEGKYASPSWHFGVLEKTEQDIQAGRTKFIDWEEAKKSIRRRAR